MTLVWVFLGLFFIALISLCLLFRQLVKREDEKWEKEARKNIFQLPLFEFKGVEIVEVEDSISLDSQLSFLSNDYFSVCRQTRTLIKGIKVMIGGERVEKGVNGGYIKSFPVSELSSGDIFYISSLEDLTFKKRPIEVTVVRPDGVSLLLRKRKDEYKNMVNDRLITNYLPWLGFFLLTGMLFFTICYYQQCF